MTAIQMIPVDLIDPHPHNPRRDLGDLTELAASLTEAGVLQNLTVVQSPEDARRFWVVIGHRRLAAAQIACLPEVPAVVQESSLAEQIATMLAENIHRDPLSPIEEAAGYQDMLDQGMKPKDVVRLTGRSATAVHARLQLLKLPDVAQAKVHTNQASLEDAAKLNGLAPAAQEEAAKYLGTTSFDWQLKEAEAHAAAAAKVAPIIAALAALGVQDVDSEGNYRPDWKAWIFKDNVQTVDDCERAVKEAGEGCVWWAGRSMAYVQLYAPREQPVVPEPETENVNSEAARAERAAAAAAAELERDAAKAEGDQARELRDEWIRSFVQRKRILAKEQLAIVAQVSPLVLLDDAIWVDQSDLAEWLDHVEQDHDGTEALEAALWTYCPSGDRSLCLLITLHLACAGDNWQYAATNRQLTTLYRLLEQLGYPVSDVERARITPPADEDEEVE